MPSIRRLALRAMPIAVLLAFLALPAIAQDCLDYGDPMADLQLYAELPDLPTAHDVAVVGYHIFVATDEGLEIIYNAGYDFLVHVTTCDLPGSFERHMVYHNGYLFMAATGWNNPDAGLLVIDIENPHAPLVVSTLPMNGIHDLDLEGDHAYLAAGSLEVVDISDPLQPEIVASLTGCSFISLTVEDGCVYGTSQHLLYIVLVSVPTLPRWSSVVWGEWNNFGGGWYGGEGPIDIAAKGDLACVSRGEYFAHSWDQGGVFLYDVSHRTSPRYLGGHGVGGYCYGMTMADSFAYSLHSWGHPASIGQWNQMEVFDLGEPESGPVLLGAMELEDPDGGTASRHGLLRAEGDLIYMIDAYSSTSLLRIFRPQCDTNTPVVLSRFDLATTGGEIHVSWEMSGDEIPAFELEGSRAGSTWSVDHASPSPGQFMAVDNGPFPGDAGPIRYTLFARTSDEGRVMLRSEEISPTVSADDSWIVGNYPNPFNPSTLVRIRLTEAARARLELFDVRGRRLAVLLDERRPAGVHEIKWEGKTDEGHPLPSGVYTLRMIADGTVDTRKITLLR